VSSINPDSIFLTAKESLFWRKMLVHLALISKRTLIMHSVCMCVCVLVNPTLWGQNVHTKMAISKLLVGMFFFGPHEENSFKNIQFTKVFLKM